MNLSRGLFAALLLVPATARADLGSPDRPQSYLAPGASAEMGLDGSLRLGAEVTLTEYWGSGGFGAAFGFTDTRIYAEAQPLIAFNRGAHGLILGVNPGLVVDVSGHAPHYGGQLTLWGNYVHTSGPRSWWAWPLVPFVRAQLLVDSPAAFTGGLMLKLPLNVS